MNKIKYFKYICSSIFFCLLLILCIIPINKSSALDDSDSSVGFDTMSDYIKDNNCNIEGFEFKDMYKDIFTSDTNKFKSETPDNPTDIGCSILNSLFGSDDLLFYKSDNGYDYISRPSEDSGILDSIGSLISSSVSDALCRDMNNIVHPIDTLQNKVDKGLDKILNPIENLSTSNNSSSSSQDLIDKFDNYCTKREDNAWMDILNNSVSNIETWNDLKEEINRQEATDLLDTILYYHDLQDNIAQQNNDDLNSILNEQQMQDELNQLQNSESQDILDMSMNINN